MRRQVVFCNNSRAGNGATIRLLAIGLALCWAPAAVAQLTAFSVIDYPGAISTNALGINEAGDIVGNYTAPDRIVHGYLLRAGQFTTIDFPGAMATAAWAINRTGAIGGWYDDASRKRHGFLLSGGRFTTIDFPGAEMSQVTGINTTGEIVGMHWNPSGDTKHRAFLFSGGRFAAFEHPDAGQMSCLSDINDEGDMFGHWQEPGGVVHGWLIRQGKMSSFDYPGARQTWWIASLNSAGEIAGSFDDPRGKRKGFVWSKGSFTPFDIPGSRAIESYRMNASGQIVGFYRDADAVTHGFLTRIAPTWRSQVLTVDDDGADCPGALTTIQEAVTQAPAGATILVCPGIYRGTVNIAGQAKTALKLIAIGGEGAVILQGDYTERDGFHLMDVTNVLIRGFTVRDFGSQPTTATQWGTGNQIRLMNSHYNTIEHNRVINGDMMGIMLVDSGNNVVQHNFASVDNSSLANCGIHVQGAKSENNLFYQNMLLGNKVAGIMISNAGPGNLVANNTVLGNGRDGITNTGTDGTWIEGNRVSYNRGPWGATPYAPELVGVGRGINVQNSSGVTLFDNKAHANTGVDIFWDEKGENVFDSNACSTASQARVCGR